MALVSKADVAKIVSTTGDVEVFIEIASDIVSENLGGKGLTAKRLKSIELFLTAHFIKIREPELAAESLGDASNSYRNNPSIMHGLTSSLYGQTACVLDTSGTLGRFGNPAATVEICN